MDLSKDMNDKIVKFSWRKWVIGIIFVLLTIGVVMLFSINGAQNVNHALTDGTILENVYYVTQIVASLAVVIGGIIGVWQYTLTTKAERSKMNIECIQRAIDLAEYYKNNILKKYAPIQFVYKNSGLMEIVKKIDKSKIDVFDKTELNSFLGEEGARKIETIRQSDKFIQAVMQADEIYNLNLNIDKVAKVKVNDEKKEATISLNRSVIIQKFMGNIVTEALNNLEFFAMHFSHGTADESVVYQSLHQTYLMMVYVLYYNIAVLNELEGSKYYTNVIELYKKWDQRDQEEKQKKISMARNYTNKGSIVNKI